MHANGVKRTGTAGNVTCPMERSGRPRPQGATGKAALRATHGGETGQRRRVRGLAPRPDGATPAGTIEPCVSALAPTIATESKLSLLRPVAAARPAAPFSWLTEPRDHGCYF
jgi:hypothetical protein